MTPLLLLVSAQLALASQSAPDVAAPAEAAASSSDAAEGAAAAVPEAPAEGASAPGEASSSDASSDAAAPGAEPGSAEASPAPSAPKAAEPGSDQPRFYVVDPHVVNMPEAVQRAVSSAIAQALEEEGMQTFTRDDVREIFGQASDLAVLDADADQLSLGTLGQAVGAEWIVAAVVTKLDDGDISIQMRLIDVAKATAAARRETRANDFGGDILAATKDATKLVLAPLFAHMKGTLALSISEEGADVLLDGQQIGVSPLDAAIPLTGGHHVLTIAKAGFVRHQETLHIEQGSALTRDVALRPSLDFLKEYNASASLYRTLAWSTTAGALVLGAAAGAFTGGYFYFAGEKSAAVEARDAAVASEGLNAANPSHDNRLAELEQPITAAGTNAELSSIGGFAVGAVGVTVALIAGYFWIFGDEPGRYDEYNAEYGL